MIEQPTVFILGAGASIPYGLPSGAGLRSIICDGAAGGSGAYLPVLLNSKLGTDPHSVYTCANAFSKSGMVSIDAFLARRPEFAEVGKLCIAAALCQKENPNLASSFGFEDHWYELLWEALTRDAMTINDVRQNRVHIYTFNYDRSLEYFLFEATKNTYGASDEDALTTVKTINIHHLYGSLGEFAPSYGENCRPYNAESGAGDIRIAARNIRIIPEARDDDSAFYRARESIAHCKRLCILGFGFDPLNVARLKIPVAIENAISLKGAPAIFTSALGKTSSEMGTYQLQVCGNFLSWTAFRGNSSMTIRETGVLLA
jgi:hypothetical protein